MSNDVRSQDAEQCEESEARYLLSLTFAETISSVILMTCGGGGGGGGGGDEVKVSVPTKHVCA